MIIDGAVIHVKCGGLGIISFDEDGVAEICSECMGTGMVNTELEIE